MVIAFDEIRGPTLSQDHTFNERVFYDFMDWIKDTSPLTVDLIGQKLPHVQFLHDETLLKSFINNPLISDMKKSMFLSIFSFNDQSYQNLILWALYLSISGLDNASSGELNFYKQKLRPNKLPISDSLDLRREVLKKFWLMEYFEQFNRDFPLHSDFNQKVLHIVTNS